MHHLTDRITQTTAFVTPVVEHWLEREIAQWVHPIYREGAICSCVVRAFAHGAMARRIDPSRWTHRAIYRSSQCSMTGGGGGGGGWGGVGLIVYHYTGLTE